LTHAGVGACCCHLIRQRSVVSYSPTESVSHRFEQLDLWSAAEILDTLWEAQAAAVASVRPVLPVIGEAVTAALPGMRRGGRIVYCGAGTSGRLAMQDGVELTPTFGWPAARLVFLLAGGPASLAGAVENAEDDRDAARIGVAAHGMDDRDLVICVAASGTTPFTVTCLEEANLRGALTVGIASNPDSPLLKSARAPILTETGGEVISGSTRLKAGTAQKIVLNLLSTLLMIRMGHVYRGMMVDMKIGNEKLRKRAIGMVCILGGVTERQAADALAGGGERVKNALLIVRGVSPADADRLLREHEGSLRSALAAVG
jgi:N-acetylmuramic acid 6-phosphate etherase